MTAGDIAPFQQNAQFGHSLPWTLASALQSSLLGPLGHCEWFGAGEVLVLLGLTSDQLGLSLQPCKAFTGISWVVFMTTRCPHVLSQCCCRSKGCCVEKRLQNNSRGGAKTFSVQKSGRYDIQKVIDEIFSATKLDVRKKKYCLALGKVWCAMNWQMLSLQGLWFGHQVEKMQNCPVSMQGDFFAVSR